MRAPLIALYGVQAVVTVGLVLTGAISKPPIPGGFVLRQTQQEQTSSQGSKADVSPTIPTPGQGPTSAPDQKPHPRNSDPSVEGRVDVSNWIIVALTAVIAYASYRTWRVYEQIRDHATEVERAYIVLSPQTRLWGDQVSPILSRPIDFRRSVGVGGSETMWECWMTIETQNKGRTPANILGGGLWLQLAPDTYPPPHPLPEIPLHFPFRLDPTFIVPNDNPNNTSMIYLTDAAYQRVISGEDCLWLVGFVDYVDRFGKMHRGGYGRRYDRHANRLIFDRTTTAFNFDRPLAKDDRARYKSKEKG